MPEFVKAARTCPQCDFLPELHSVWYVPSVWNCSPRYFLGMTYSSFKSSMSFPHGQNVFLNLFCWSMRWTQYCTVQTGPYVALPQRDLYDTLQQFLLTQGRVGLFWSPKYVGCIGEDELKVEEEDDDEEPNAWTEAWVLWRSCTCAKRILACGLQKLMCSFRAVMPKANHARRRCGCTTCTYTVVYRLHES